MKKKIEKQELIDEAIYQKNQTYVMSNRLARVPKQMDIIPARIFCYALSQLSYYESNNDKNKKDEYGRLILSFPLSQMINDLKMENSNWNFYVAAIDRMESKALLKWDNDKEFCKTRIFSKVSYDKETKNVDLIFNPGLTNELTNLSMLFAKYSLEDVSKLKSKYSLQMLWYLVSCLGDKDKIEIKFSTKDLKHFYGLTKESYSYKNKFMRAQFESQCIEPLFEINDLPNYKLRIIKTKESNKVVGYKFILESLANSEDVIDVKPTNPYALTDEEKAQTKELIHQRQTDKQKIKDELLESNLYLKNDNGWSDEEYDKRIEYYMNNCAFALDPLMTLSQIEFEINEEW